MTIGAGGGMTRKRVIAPLLLLLFAAGVVHFGWDPYPRTARSFDAQNNGLWLGHKWYTGRSVRTDEPVSRADLHVLTRTLERNGVRYAFVHVGPVTADGGLDDEPGEMLSQLHDAVPEVMLLAWLGARVEKVDLHDAAWRRAVIASLHRLHDQGFDGVHFDLEPMRDHEPGYLELLEAVRAEFGTSFFLSQATPRSAPFGLSLGPLKRSFWSGAYYRKVMERADQTVLMAYDTRLTFARGYVEFVRHQSRLLIDWAREIPNHQLLIGVPSYEDVPLYSDPNIENLRTAALGVRAALESYDETPACFRGVAVYANWVTDEDEWRDFHRYWVAPRSEDLP